MKKILLAIVLFLAPSVLAAQVPSGFTKLVNQTGLTFTDSACPNLTTCQYVVTAVDLSGVESAPAPCAVTQLCVNGDIAVVVMPSSGTHTVTIAITASPTTGVTYNYYVHRGPLPPGSIAVTVN